MATVPLDPLSTDKFLGLVNTLDPLQAPKGSLTEANNVDIDDAAAIRRRDGYTSATTFTNIQSIFATKDQLHAYAIDNGDLISIEADFTRTILASGFLDGVYKWEEVGKRVYILGPTTGVIDRGVFKPWGVPHCPQPSATITPGTLDAGRYLVSCVYVNEHGEAGGASAAIVVELLDNQAINIELPVLANHKVTVYVSSKNGETLYKAGTTTNISFLFNDEASLIAPMPKEQQQRYPVPSNATQLAYSDGRMYVSEYSQANNASYLYSSEPFWLGLFDIFKNYTAIPSQIRMLEAYSTGLVIGTDVEIYAYSIEYGLTLLASYGVPEGTQASADPQGILYFWTNRGVCRVPDFANLSQERVSVPPGNKCATAFMEQQGYNRFLISTDDSGLENNKYT